MNYLGMFITLLGKVTIFLCEGTWTLLTKFVTLPGKFVTLPSKIRLIVPLPTKNFIWPGHNSTGYIGQGYNVIGQRHEFTDKCTGQGQDFTGQGHGLYPRALG